MRAGTMSSSVASAVQVVVSRVKCQLMWMRMPNAAMLPISASTMAHVGLMALRQPQLTTFKAQILT